MSLQAYNAVWQHSTARGTDLLVLLALADFADEKGWSYPSIDALAKKARISQRATQDRLRALESAGAIKIEIQTGPHGTNRYQVKGLKGTQDLHPAGSAPPPQIRDGKRDAKRDEDLHPNRKEALGTVRNQKGLKASSLPAEDDLDFEFFWAEYPSQNWPVVPNPKPGKQPARDQWNKLTNPEKRRAVQSLPHYRAYLELNDQQTKHCERYLRQRLFDGYLVAPTPKQNPRAGPVPGRNARNFEAVIQRLGVNDASRTSTTDHAVPERGLPEGRVEPGEIRALG